MPSRPNGGYGLRLGLCALLGVACTHDAAVATPPEAGRAAPGVETRQGYPMIPPGRLAAMRAAVASGAPEWKALQANVDAKLAQPATVASSAMNVAVVHLMTGDRRYCDHLAGEARELVRSANPRADSYYAYAGIMEALGTTLAYCGALLDGPSREAIAGQLDSWTDELWFHNRGSGWGLKDPGNNYHLSFLLGTAWAGLALASVGHPNADKYLGIATRGAAGVLAYVDERCPGGGWIEGTNYGIGAKGRLADLSSLLAAAGIANPFRATGFFPAALLYAHYLLQPGNVYLYPAGDMSRESDMPAGPLDRQSIQQMVYWLPDSDARAHGQWYLEHVVPDYRTGFRYPQALWRDLVFKVQVPSRPQDSLPLARWARGDNLVSMRSGWDAHATALTVSGASNIDQFHAHLDTGSFTLWREGWQVVDAVTFSHSGLLQEPGAHNLIHVDGARRVLARPRGILRFGDDSRASHLQIDATGLYARGDPRDPRNLLLREFTREIVYLKPDTVVVYDRVQPAAPGTSFDWRLHFPERPAASGRTLRARHGRGGVAVELVLGDPPSVVPDTDLAPDGSRSWRAQSTTRTGRFLAVLRVGSGGAPELSATHVETTGDMEGVAVGDDVVLFSKLPFGGAPRLDFSYTLPAAPGRVHTLLNVTGGVGVSCRQEADRTVVTIAPGPEHAASAEGLVRFTEPAPR
jgi:hypothetical protein